ncbi:YheT family hydrolase [Polaribacter sp. Asnod1-A03]|uniref:YheT family hydrolase n=1 Tax=Polaribacter sp. Asnod1-A03 TaxID=3160581 RepID=UPI003865F6E7
MPVLISDFSPSFPFKNAHLNTIYRSVFTKESNNYSRKRITTWDNDFIDLDFSLVGSKILVLLIHGLEGSSKSNYIISTTNHLNKKGLDAVCFNLRGCSGDDNLLLGTYHSGKTEDVDFVINHLLKNYNYDSIVILGFSLGGNLILKYIGEQAEKISPKIKVGIAISVPIDIATGELELEKFKNKIYLNRFLKSMKTKILEKSEKFPELYIDKEKISKATRFKHLESVYTAPVFGFKNPEDYWAKASSKPHLSKIKIPTLLINSKDDTFLSKKCYPFDEANSSNSFFLEVTNYGGHCGFISSFDNSKNSWLEDRIEKFIMENIQNLIL